ncbi:sorting nexin-6-like protein [Cricetulus griseus]|nr:sorting nexin-6-like protein [Cricetulus griseus]
MRYNLLLLIAALGILMYIYSVDKDRNSPRILSAEAEKEFQWVENRILDVHVDRMNLDLDCILVILPSREYLSGILMQREDTILEWIFLPHKQLTGKDPAEIIIPLTNEEISSLWKDNEYWQIALTDFLGTISNNYPKTDRIKFIKKTVWILLRIVRQTPIYRVLTFYTDANKSGKAGYKAGEVSKVVQNPYTSEQKAELYAILMVLKDFTEPLNIVIDSQYAERVVLHIETAEFVPDNTELISLFLQLQETIRNRSNPIYITHIISHTGLPGPLAQGNDEIDRLLIGSVLEASEFHKKHHVNSKGLKKDFSINWKLAKEIVKNCPTCSFYNQTPLPAGCNPKGIRRNEVWQMDVFHFAEFGNLKYVHHTIDTFSGFQWATALNSEKADSVITHLLEEKKNFGYHQSSSSGSTFEWQRKKTSRRGQMTDGSLNSDEESSVNGQNEKRLFWQASINDKRLQLKVKINNKVISGLVDTGADVTIITQKSWPQKWPLREANVQFLGIGTLSRVGQSVNSVVCIGPEGQKGILKPYVADIAINLWGRDLLQQWNTQINITPMSDTNYVQSLDSRKDLVRRYGKRLPTIHAVQKLGTNDRPSEEPKALPLKWLTDEPAWVGQWPTTSEKLEALKKLVQQQRDAGHIEESTSP